MPKKNEVVPLGEVEDTSGFEIVLDNDFEMPPVGLEVFDAHIVPKEQVLAALGATSPYVNVAVSGAISISDLITDIDDAVEFLTWVVYGKNGTGKTTLLSTADGILILAPEDGTLSIRGKAGQAKKLKVDSWEKLEQVYWLLKNGITLPNGGIRIAVAGGTFDVKYLAIDTVTKLAEVCMRNIVLGDKARDPSRDLVKKTMRDWGDMSEKMKYWIQTFEELPLQRVWVCQETTNSDDADSDEYSIYPSLNKSLRAYILSEADIIARTYIAKDAATGTVQYRLSAMPNPTFVTKDRTSKVNKGAINNPHLDKMYKLIF